MPERNHRSGGAEPSLSASLLSALLESSSECFIYVDDAGRIRACSDGASRLYGSSFEGIVGQPESVLGWAPVVPTAQDETVVERQTIRRVDDPESLVPVVVRSRAVHDVEHGVRGTFRLIRDVSDDVRREAELLDRERSLSEALRALRSSHRQLKTAQLALIQAAKLESMGRIAAGVAHEVKNPLAVVLMGAQLLRKRLASTDAIVSETLDDIEHAVRRANGIIIGLLDFAASNELKVETADLNEVASAAVQLVRHELTARHVSLERSEEPLPRLSVDRTKIEQVLVNLMMNAMHAMPKGGSIRLTTALRQLTQPGHGVGFRQTDVLKVGQTVAVIEVADTGTGIPSDLLPRIFDPFFTTKGPGQGAGLGLAVCRTIVQLHGGAIWMENRPEGGARAIVALPAGEHTKGGQHVEATDPAGR
jgi:signal transduction histidine kinase